MDLLEIHAREKVGQSPEWHVYLWKVLPENAKEPFYYELTGAVAPAKKRGSGYNWRKIDKATDSTVHILVSEHAAWAKAWEEKTGQCRNCVGTGKVFAKWSKEMGTQYTPCLICEGTGKHASADVASFQPVNFTS